MNGKGDSPRPLSVDATTFATNWDKIFRVKDDTDPEYTQELMSGMFWEWYPGLSGIWEEDKSRWRLAKTTQLSQKQGEYNATSK